MNKEELKKKLLLKKEELKDKRTSNFIKNNKKLNINKDNENEFIFYTTQELMNDVRKLISKGERNIPKIDNILKQKFAWLRENKFAIYKAVLQNGSIDLNLLRMMLMEKERIENNEVDVKKASLNVGEKLADKFNIDVDSLVKEAKKNKEKKEKLDKNKNN